MADMRRLDSLVEPLAPQAPWAVSLLALRLARYAVIQFHTTRIRQAKVASPKGDYERRLRRRAPDTS